MRDRRKGTERHIRNSAEMVVLVVFWTPLVVLFWHFGGWLGIISFAFGGLVNAGMELRRAWKAWNA